MSLNPILSNQRNINLYSLAWFVIISFHAGVLYFLFGLSKKWAIFDAFAFDFWFAVLAVGFWYTIRYISLEPCKIGATILNHLITAGIFILLWLGVAYFILGFFKPLDAEYASFLPKALPGRIFYGILYYSVILLIYYLHIYYVSYSQTRIRESELHALVRESELRLLKSQLNPHFIFNSLNSISSLTLSNPNLAQQMIIQLSSYIRYALKQDKNELVNFSEELEYTHLYLSIEKVRFGEKLNFETNCPPETLEAKIPNMIIQPLIENAIKYGVYESLTPVTIR
ncbi:MAG: histidine kinase, partial [Cytophagales bacterium]|nr:histidine kinase [Cytophagales bacterium]